MRSETSRRKVYFMGIRILSEIVSMSSLFCGCYYDSFTFQNLV